MEPVIVDKINIEPMLRQALEEAEKMFPGEELEARIDLSDDLHVVISVFLKNVAGE